MDRNQQLAQMLGQTQGDQSMLDWLKSFITPNTPVGALANQDAYMAYVVDETSKGNEPLSRVEWLKLQEGAR